MPEIDAALLIVSVLPFMVFWNGKAETSDMLAGNAIGVISTVFFGAIISKAIYGRLHLFSRLCVGASGLWGVLGFIKPDLALVLPFHLGVPAQHLWMVGVFLFVFARSRRIKEEVKRLLASRKMQ